MHLEAHKISKHYVVEGGGKEKICGDKPVKDTKMWNCMLFLRQDPANYTLTGGISLYSKYFIWEYPPPPSSQEHSTQGQSTWGWQHGNESSTNSND